MQDKIFRGLLIASAVVIPIIGGELSIPSQPMLPERLNTLDSGISYFRTTG